MPEDTQVLTASTPPCSSVDAAEMGAHQSSTKKTAIAAVRVSPSSSSYRHKVGDVETDDVDYEGRTESVGDEKADQASHGEGEIDYKTMSWFHAGVVMIAETISLGILSLPSALATVGFVPGVIFILGLGLIATYTGYVMWQVKMKYPEASSFADCIALMFGKPGQWIGNVMQCLILVFIMGAHVVIFSVMMNVVTEHGLCTVVFMIIGAAVSFVVSLPRTFKANSAASMCSCISIAAATIVAMVSIGIDRPGIGDTYAVVPVELTSFSSGAMSVSNIILAYNGHIAYPSIISEMKEPRDFPKALALLETVTITFYLVVAVVIYYFAGEGVMSPALGSAGPLVRKIAYGIATPTIIVAGVIAAVVAAKLIYEHVWSKQPHVKQEKSFRARASWYAILAVLYFSAWLIAEVIPVFRQLTGVIGALFGTWFALGFCSMLWLWMNWRGSLSKSYAVNWKKMALAGFNVFILVLCVAICVLGMYGSIKAIAENGGDRKPFSCADNSQE